MMSEKHLIDAWTATRVNVPCVRSTCSGTPSSAALVRPPIQATEAIGMLYA